MTWTCCGTARCQRCSAGSGHRHAGGRSCARPRGEREKAPEKTPGGSCAEAEGQAVQCTTQRAHRGRCEGGVQTPRPASLAVATSLDGAARVEEAWSYSVRSPFSRAFHQTAGDGHPHSTSPPFPALSEALRDGSGRCCGPPLLVL